MSTSRVIGVLGADAVSRPRYFTPQEITLVKVMADQLALAVITSYSIHYTKLYERIFMAFSLEGRRAEAASLFDHACPEHGGDGQNT